MSSGEDHYEEAARAMVDYMADGGQSGQDVMVTLDAVRVADGWVKRWLAECDKQEYSDISRRMFRELEGKELRLAMLAVGQLIANLAYSYEPHDQEGMVVLLAGKIAGIFMNQRKARN